MLAAFGAGNGALFQLVPLRWPPPGGRVDDRRGRGALGGGFIPNAMGQSKQRTGSYLWGFVAFAAVALAMIDDARGADPLDPHLGRKARRRPARQGRCPIGRG